MASVVWVAKLPVPGELFGTIASRISRNTRETKICSNARHAPSRSFGKGAEVSTAAGLYRPTICTGTSQDLEVSFQGTRRLERPEDPHQLAWTDAQGVQGLH